MQDYSKIKSEVSELVKIFKDDIKDCLPCAGDIAILIKQEGNNKMVAKIKITANNREFFAHARREDVLDSLWDARENLIHSYQKFNQRRSKGPCSHYIH